MRWEYFVHTINVEGMLPVFSGKVKPNELQDLLNEYGLDGWELISAFDTNAAQGASKLIVLTFKRPIIELT